MGKLRINFKIDWKSKFADLLIVIIGITIAFQLNSWNESKKKDAEVKDYISSFYEENSLNQINLREELDFSISNKNDIDTLKQILLSRNYDDQRIKPLSTSMMAMAQFSPSITTMENIKASGDFDLIKDIDLRKKLINTYNSYTISLKLESLLSEYLNTYVTPFFFENVRFSDFSAIDPNFIEDPQFENIIFGYEVLLSQQIKGYSETLEKVGLLDESLTAASK